MMVRSGNPALRLGTLTSAALLLLLGAGGTGWPQSASPQSTSPPLGLQEQGPPPSTPAPPAREENPGLINQMGKLFDKLPSILPPIKSPSETMNDLSRLAKPSTMVSGRMACPASQKGAPMSRTEQDFLGQREIADDIYYGVQTIRGKENFHITGIPMNQEPYFVKALGYVKKAAAMANCDLGALDAKVADAIILGCDRVIAGDMMDQFVTDFIQGGAGTSTNMNANEVIANLALESLGFKKGDYQHVSPNDHVNYGQSTNDTYPTAFRLALILRLR